MRTVNDVFEAENPSFRCKSRKIGVWPLFAAMQCFKFREAAWGDPGSRPREESSASLKLEAAPTVGKVIQLTHEGQHSASRHPSKGKPQPPACPTT